ncbi:ABC transporter substrate-binding protein [Reinekea sp. G2M2-21]|uniref:substrate-binding periplasmic protein n=1 Tax=Reinekea sp. G2M2-21 TaxID=2788942 RepID=UPI001E634BD6|nr:ABC transporter substrate-binding protein [Reinekea sp. G2M2-21]
MLYRYLAAVSTAMILTVSQAAGEVVTLYTEEAPPYSTIVGNRIRGLSVDIVKTLFDRSKLQYEIQMLPLKRAIYTTLLETNSCVFPLERNQEREVEFHWVSPVLLSQTAFYVLKNSGIEIRTLEDVEGYIVGSYSGSATANYLASQGIKTSVIPYDAPNIRMLENKRIDIWASDTLVADYLLKQNRNTNIEKKLVYFTTLRALACNLEFPPTAIERLSENLAEMYRDGTIQRLMDKYQSSVLN